MRNLLLILVCGIVVKSYGQFRPSAVGDSLRCGTVFYVETIDSLGNQRGLICARQDISPGIRWHNGSYSTTGANVDRLFDKANADTIIRKQGDSLYAATICDRFRPDTFCFNWYLPSKIELNLVYINLAKIGMGNFSKEGYWTSIEGTDSSSSRVERRAWIIDFFDGKIFQSDKVNKWRVRPVHAFRNNRGRIIFL